MSDSRHLRTSGEVISCFIRGMTVHKWQGPATVIGIDGRQVIVKHGGSCAHVHVFKLRHHNGEDFSDMLSGPEDGTTDGDNAGLNVPPIEVTDWNAYWWGA